METAAAPTAAPPFSLPGSHFATGLVFLLSGAVGLVAAVPALSVGAFLAPTVTAVTHLFTLGWITVSIMGALYQFVPVALGRPMRWTSPAPWTLAVYASGVLLLVLGMLTQRGGLAAVGGALVGLAVLVFVANLLATLARAPERDLTWWALALAALFLVLTVALGGTLSANLNWWFLGGDRLTAIAVHLHVAVAGWVMLVVVGVGQRLLPMFLLSHGADERPAAWAVGLLSSGTALLFAVHHVPEGLLRRAPAALILAGMAAFLLQARAFFRHRRRRSLDPGLRSAAAALALVGVGSATGGVYALAGLSSTRLVLAYVMAVILGLSVFVAAHYYKIVPFLVFYHRYGPLVGRHPVPRVTDLYSPAAAAAAGWALVAGAGTLILGVGARSVVVGYLGAIIFLTGATVECGQMYLLFRRRPRWDS
ncbi:MAG TPA: hypothetical protein VK858_21530 [Longimicrobiales bacterium]|nr:hypothetical protein [Longimicrobiales bacterium]